MAVSNSDRRLGNSVRRRGSIEQNDDHQQMDGSELHCPKCRQLFKSPLVLSCKHSVCKCCLEHLYQKSKRANGFYHCPVCNKPYATSPDALVRDRKLESRVRQFSRSQQSNRHQEETGSICQKSGCDLEAENFGPCPHCQLRLCQEHYEEDRRLINQNLVEQHENVKRIRLELQDVGEDCRLQKRNIDSAIEDNAKTYEELIQCLENKFKAMQTELKSSKNKIDVAERKVNELHHQLCDLQTEIESTLDFEEDDQSTIRKKYDLVVEAESLNNSIELPNFPEDVRFNYTTASIQEIEKKIEELKVLQHSLEARVVEKATVEVQEDDFRPHQAVLWSHTGGYCLTSDGLVQRQNQSIRDPVRPLPDEVLIVCDLMKLHVLSLDGEFLGKIRVVDGTTPFIAKHLALSTDGRILVLLSQYKVLLCDMDGTIRLEIKPDSEESINALHGLCSAALSEKYLMLVAPGNTTHNKPGAIFILEAPRFDFSRAQRIPLDQRRIFPTGVTHVRGSFLVLTNRLQVEEEPESASNELLMYDARTHKFVAEMLISDGLQSGLYICSDDSGRVFVSQGRRTRRDDRRPRSSCAKVDVLDPQGHRIGAIGGSDRDFTTCNGISVSDARSAAGRPTRLVACDATRRLVHVYTLG